MKNSKRNRFLKTKFLSLLSLAGIEATFTATTTNAMFVNPRLGMPLIPTTDGRIIFFNRQIPPAPLTPTQGNPTTKSSTTLTTNTLTTTSSSSVSISSSNSLSTRPISSPIVNPTTTTTGKAGTTLRDFGDGVNTGVTSIATSSIANNLRGAGDRFIID